jgi:hypothetical protein
MTEESRKLRTALTVKNSRTFAFGQRKSWQ